MKVFLFYFNRYLLALLSFPSLRSSDLSQTEFRCAGSESQILNPVVVAPSNQLAFGRASAVQGNLAIEATSKS